MKRSQNLILRFILCVGVILMICMFSFPVCAANNWIPPYDAYADEYSDRNYLDVAMANNPSEEVLLRPYYFKDGSGEYQQVNASVNELILKEGGSADFYFTVEYDGGRIESGITLTYNDKDDAQAYSYKMFTFDHDTKQYYYDSISQDPDDEGVYHDFGSDVALYRPQNGVPCLMFSIGGLNCLYMEIAGVRGLAGGNVSSNDNYGSDNDGIPVGIVIALISGVVVIIGGLVIRAKKVKTSKPKTACGNTHPAKDVIITDPATGAQTRYVQDPATGDWVDPERGGMLDPSRLPEWMRQRQNDRKWVDQQNKKLQTGDNAFDKKIAEERAKQKTTDSQIDELIRISQRVGALPQSEINDNIRKNAHKLVDKLIKGTEPVSQEAIERVKGAFIKSATSKIISGSELPKVPSDLSLFGNAFINEVEEVSRNQTASAVFFRTIFAIPTLGASEIFFQSHKGYLRMRDYVDEGGNSIVGGGLTAAWGSIKDFIVSKTADKIMGKVHPSIPNLNKSSGGKIIYNQVKRFVKGDISTTDKNTLDIDGKIRRAIKRKFN